MKTPSITGTKEWAVANVNCVSGCPHNCRYCYAKAMAKRFKRIASDDDWARPVVRPHEVQRRRRRVKGTIMFPTAHDITPEILEPCLTVLGNLLGAGNRVLVVSKPHLPCIEELCRRFSPYREQILFRFSIGAISNGILGYWEPHAPRFEERLAGLKHAFGNGFATSISMEPMLEVDRAAELVELLAPYVTDAIWFGRMNRIRSCFRPTCPEDERAIRRIEEGQTDAKTAEVYRALAGHPLLKWKDSVKRVLGLRLPAEAGLDV